LPELPQPFFALDSFFVILLDEEGSRDRALAFGSVWQENGPWMAVELLIGEMIPLGFESRRRWRSPRKSDARSHITPGMPQGEVE
jgi:hypothetical protein